jgi:cation/acetate symporter
MGVLFAPFVRKYGAYTLPTFLGRRFESRTVRIVAAATLSAPILLLLVAEARFAAYASAWLLGQSERLMVAVVMTCATAIVIAGGMRSLTWSSVAKAIAALLALAVPVSIVALMVSNLPLPQMTHGNVLRLLTRAEINQGVPIVLAPPLAFDLPREGVEQLVKRFIQSFGSIGSLALFSCLRGGGRHRRVSGPLSRSGTTPVRGAQVAGLGARRRHRAVDAAGRRCHLRAMLLDQVVGHPGDSLPAWFQLLQQSGIARIEAKTQVVRLAGIGFERDAVLFALPIAAGLPQVVVYLALAGALAAALAALASSLVAIAGILAEDIVYGLPDETAPEAARIGTARVAMLGVAFVTAWLAIAAPADPLQLFLWSLSLSASASFPVLLLAIWVKRTNAWGALAGMITGFAVTVFMMLLSETGAIGFPSALAGAVGLPLAFAAALGATRLTPAPGRNALDIVREVRVPGGETLYDRELRLLRLKNRTPA